MAMKRTVLYLKNYFSENYVRVNNRCYAKLSREQDPEEVNKMPIFQYATENTKRRKRVYMWGNALYGALGNINFIKPVNNRKPLKTMHFPWRQPFAELHKVRDIACGYGFTVFAASNEENDFSLFGVGLNTDFQIGYHCQRKNRPLEIVGEPVPIALPLYNTNTKAIKVACGRAHTIVLTDREGIFSLGNNSYGQCGVLSDASRSKEDLIKVNRIEGIDENIAEVVCGQDHTLLLSTSGKVYSFGWGADGQTAYAIGFEGSIQSVWKAFKIRKE